MDAFCERLKELIAEKYGTQKAFAEAHNFSKNQVHYWLKGKAEPSIAQIRELCRIFECSADYLLCINDV